MIKCKNFILEPVLHNRIFTKVICYFLLQIYRKNLYVHNNTLYGITLVIMLLLTYYAL